MARKSEDPTDITHEGIPQEGTTATATDHLSLDQAHTAAEDPSPAQGYAEDFRKIGGAEGTDLGSRVEGVESLLERVTHFLSWLFPQHAVPGTDSENAEGKTGPGAPPASAGPANPTPTPGVQQSEQPGGLSPAQQQPTPPAA